MTYDDLSTKAKKICDRYQENYVTDDQLLQYRDRVHAITAEEYDYIYGTKHPVEEPTEEPVVTPEEAQAE